MRLHLAVSGEHGETDDGQIRRANTPWNCELFTGYAQRRGGRLGRNYETANGKCSREVIAPPACAQARWETRGRRQNHSRKDSGMGSWINLLSHL